MNKIISYNLGTYYIDPNEGSAKDAIEAYCDMTTKSTCIFASPSKIDTKFVQHKGSKVGHSWFSEMKQGFTVKHYYVIV